MARYDSYYLGQLQQLGQLRSLGNGAIDRSAKVYRKVILAVPTVSVALLVATLILVAAPK
jgi:phycobilisome rod-core linker protein